jgi:hypothetical protein
MAWSELPERKLVMGMSSDHFAFGDQLAKLSNRGKKHLFICSFEVLVLLSIQKSNEVRNGGDTESLSTIPGDLGVYCHKNKIWIVV